VKLFTIAIFQHGHKVGENLCRVKFIGQAIPYGNARIFCQYFHIRLYLRNRKYTKLLDFTPKEIQSLLDLSRDLKRAKYAGCEQQKLKGKNEYSASISTSACLKPRNSIPS
jgi:hypothetical protein